MGDIDVFLVSPHGVLHRVRDRETDLKALAVGAGDKLHNFDVLAKIDSTNNLKEAKVKEHAKGWRNADDVSFMKKDGKIIYICPWSCAYSRRAYLRSQMSVELSKCNSTVSDNCGEKDYINARRAHTAPTVAGAF